MQSGGIGKNQQEVGINQIGDHSGEVIVIAEFCLLNLINGNDVVFIDDGYHPQLQQSQKGIAGVQITGAVGEVRPGQQSLGNGNIMPVEQLLVDIHEAALPG